jgi:hypothetical protein
MLRKHRPFISLDAGLQGDFLAQELYLTARKCHGLRKSNTWEGLSTKDLCKSMENAERAFRIFYPFLYRKSKLCLYNKLLLYKSCIRPILCYEVETWYDCAATHKSKLQIIQNKCLKIIKHRHWRYSTFDLHQETNIPMIEAFGEKIYEKFMQRCRFSENPLILEIIDS